MILKLTINNIYDNENKKIENKKLNDKLFNSISNFIQFIENENNNKIKISYELTNY